MTIKPFFARFLESQKLPAAPTAGKNTPTMQTMKYPSDNDTFDPNDRGYAVKLKREGVVKTPPYVAEFRPEGVTKRPEYADLFRREVIDSSVGLKQADPGPGTPGGIQTMKYPSDSDSIGKLFY